MKSIGSKVGGAIKVGPPEGAGAGGCSGGLDACAPVLTADGADLTLSAAGGDVLVATAQCDGTVSVCAMSQSIMALGQLVTDLANL